MLVNKEGAVKANSTVPMKVFHTTDEYEAWVATLPHASDVGKFMCIIAVACWEVNYVVDFYMHPDFNIQFYFSHLFANEDGDRTTSYVLTDILSDGDQGACHAYATPKDAEEPRFFDYFTVTEKSDNKIYLTLLSAQNPAQDIEINLSDIAYTPTSTDIAIEIVKSRKLF